MKSNKVKSVFCWLFNASLLLASTEVEEKNICIVFSAAFLIGAFIYDKD